MTLSSPAFRMHTIPAHERLLLGFSLRLHLLYRGLLRAAFRPGEDTPFWTAGAEEAVNALHHEFIVRTSARLERAFAALHGRELRRWEDHLADIILRSETEDACSRDLLDEMRGIVESGQDLLPLLENGTAKEMSLMLSRYQRALARLEASQPVAAAKLFHRRTAEEPRPHDWNSVLNAIWSEQNGDFAPVKRGSWRCLRTALGEVAETLPVMSVRPFTADRTPGLEPLPGISPGVVAFSLAVNDRGAR